MKYFRIAFLIVVAYTCFPAFAGSYDDFFIAIKRDDGGTVARLIERGFDPNAVDPKGQRGLTLAMLEQSPRVAKALLDSPSTDVNALNAAGESPLMLAAMRGETAWFERLLERGAQVQITGWAPIHYAAIGPEPKLLEILLARGAELEARSPNGTTPLMLAARYGKEEIVLLLLQRGADARLRNERDMRAADFARSGGRESLAVKLERAANR